MKADPTLISFVDIITVLPFSKSMLYFTVKSRSLSENRSDLVIEVRTEKEAELAKDVAALGFVSSSSLLAHDGEVTY